MVRPWVVRGYPVRNPMDNTDGVHHETSKNKENSWLSVDTQKARGRNGTRRGTSININSGTSSDTRRAAD